MTTAATATAAANVSMDNILAEISTDSIANKIDNIDINDTMDTSLADYSVNTDADRTQPLVLTRQSLVNTLMPPVPDSPEPSPSTSPFASPKKVTFVNVKTESKDLPPIEHDLSVHSMPELGKRSNWDSDSDDSDLTLASPFPKRNNKVELNEEEDVVVEDRVLLETVTVKNGMLIEHVVDLGIAENVNRVVEEPEKKQDEIIPDAESSVIEPQNVEKDLSSSSIIYTPVKTEDIQTPEQHSNEDEFNDNPFLENGAPSGDTSISTFDSANYVLSLPFDDSLYEPIETEADPFQNHSSKNNVETSIFDIWNNQNVYTSKTSRFEFDCIKSPIKSDLKVAETKLNVKVLDKRIYSNSSSVIDRLEVKPIIEKPQRITPDPVDISMLTVDLTDMSNHGFTLEEDDDLNMMNAELNSNSSLHILTSVWKKERQPVLMLTHSDTFERLHLKTKSMVMQENEAKIVSMDDVGGKITTNELKYWPSQHGEYVHEMEENESVDEDEEEENFIHSVEDLGISLPKGNISPARKTMVAKFEQSRKQMELKKEHEKLQETLKHKLREQARKEELLRAVEEEPVVLKEEVSIPTHIPIYLGPDHVFLYLNEVRNIKIPDLRKFNGKVQIILDNGSHIIKTAFYPLDYHGVVKVSEEFELAVDPNAISPQQLIMTLKVKYDVPQDKVVYTEGQKKYKQVKTKWWKKTETVEIKTAPVKSVIKAVDPIKGYIAPDGSFAKYKLNLNEIPKTRTTLTFTCFNEWMKTKVQKGVVENNVVENICTLHIETKKSSHDTASLSLSCGDVVVETPTETVTPSPPLAATVPAQEKPVDELYSL